MVETVEGLLMLYNAKNGAVPIENTEMEYISFGSGEKTLIMLPGLGDGLKTARGLALPFALMFRKYAGDYKVYVFSRKNALEEGYSTRDMARDTKEAMDRLGIAGADIIGISQGGMIAQYIAVDYPDEVGKLVLAVTLARPNPLIREAVVGWLRMAEAGDYKGLFIDTAERSYSEAYLKKTRPLYPLLARFSRPKTYDRFLIQARACVEHDAWDELDKIACPTLVIGGDCDRVVGAEASREIAGKIENSRLWMYAGLGHGAYEEAKDFHDRVLDFLR